MVRAEGIGQRYFISVKPEAGGQQAKYLDSIDRILWGLGISVNFFEGAVPSRIVITHIPVDEQLSEITLVFIPRNQGDVKTTALFGKALMDPLPRGVIGVSISIEHGPLSHVQCLFSTEQKIHHGNHQQGQ
jgi:hypothetical protein